MQALEDDYRLQRRLEVLYALPTSRSDCRTVITNRWRLLPLLPQLGMQVRPPVAQLGTGKAPAVKLLLHAFCTSVVHVWTRCGHVDVALSRHRYCRIQWYS